MHRWCRGDEVVPARYLIDAKPLVPGRHSPEGFMVLITEVGFPTLADNG
jgi:hypothetical protein